MDILDDILASLRLSGGIVFDAKTRGEWRLLSRFQPEDCAPFFPTPERIISSDPGVSINQSGDPAIFQRSLNA